MICAMSERHIRNISQIKKLSSETSGKDLPTSPGKNIGEKVSFSELEMLITFQASLTTSQDNYFKIP